MENPFKEIAGIIQGQAAGQAAAALQGVPLELGTIRASGLKLDSFKHEIKDYLVADWTVTLHLPAHAKIGTMTSPVDENGNPEPGTSTSELTRFDFAEIEIPGVRVDFRAGLKPGDRVLVAPIHGGQDYVVIAKVVS
ncbi:MAG: DUF2577 family protein [Bacillota bacterium]